MDILTLVDQIVTLLQQRGRMTYGVLQRQFALDDETLAALKDELLFSYPQVREENGRGLVWVGAAPVQSSTFQVPSSHPQPPSSYTPSHLAERIRAATVTDGERKTITALFAEALRH
jgi:hypothetical protein